MSTVVAPQNDAPPASARERIAAELEGEIAALLARERTLELELIEIKADRRTFEQSLQRLRGEALRKPGRPRKASSETRPSALGAERLAAIEQAIHEYVEAQDQDEFRQIDIRSTVTGSLAKSSTMATGFEMLRQNGVIRLSRKAGNNKFFRLTEAARRDER